MKRLTEKEVRAMIQKLEDASEKASRWEIVHEHYSSIKADLEFPLGELTNPNISGYLWAWKLLGKISTKGIDKADRFNAQGLEGKISIPLNLMDALLAYRELPKYRRQIITY